MLRVNYLEHSISIMSIVALKETGIYYTNNNNNKLFLFDFKTKESIELLDNLKTSNLVCYKNNLFVLSGNKLLIYKQAERALIYINTYVLNEIPLKIRCDSNGCVFLYSRSLEIFTDKLYKINSSIEILDITTVNGISYLLTKNQDIYKCPNIFSVKDIIFSKLLIKNNDNKNFMTSIEYQNESSSIILSNNHITEKYELKDSVMILQYTFKYPGILFDGILCGENAIEIGKGPFILVPDKLIVYKKFNSYDIGVSNSRVYFISYYKEESVNNMIFEFPDSNLLIINPKEIEIPDYINNDESLVKKYRDLEMKIKKYDIIYNKISEISKSFEKRENEILKLEQSIKKSEEDLNSKAKKLQKRMSDLEKKAMCMGSEKDVEELKEKLKLVDSMIKKFKHNRFAEYKKRLLFQKHTLQSRFK